MTFAVTAAGVGAAGAIAGGALSAQGAKQGAAANRKAQIASWQMAQPYYQSGQYAMQPYKQAGDDALWRLRDLLGFYGNKTSSSGKWAEPITMQRGAQEAGINYEDIVKKIGPDDIKALVGYTPKEAFAPTSMGDISDAWAQLVANYQNRNPGAPAGSLNTQPELSAEAAQFDRPSGGFKPTWSGGGNNYNRR